MDLVAGSAEETEAFGARLAASRPQTHSLTIIYLTGELGAGKTTLARGLLRGLGVTRLVRSPSYGLLELYELAQIVVLHLDLYRIADPAELEQLGLREWARADHLWLVEWPERGTGRLPPADLAITLTARAQGHAINLLARSPLGESWLYAVEK